ncbi:MAG: hypothetical protein KAU50_00940 [Candidatus Marinimicrobia bacterium]|nr:hypothetical protein [Candidatus Neomarinimicrobiota bacterium]
MMQARISFYYPVANSIDHSRDYWTRDTSHVMEWSLSLGGRPEKMIGREPSRFEYAPYAVTFTETNAEYSLTADYRFCNEQPAYYEVINTNRDYIRIPVIHTGELDKLRLALPPEAGPGTETLLLVDQVSLPFTAKAGIE